MFWNDTRAQSIQVGAVLLFGVLIILISTWQAYQVPNQNEGIEFNHNQEVQKQMTELRTTVNSMPDVTTTRSTTVDLGVRYPSRTIFRNPPPTSGTIQTVGTTDTGFNISIENATAVEGEVNDFWTGKSQQYDTGAIEYQPRYNEYKDAPRTIYEHSVLYNKFDREGQELSMTGQTLVRDDRITIVVLNGTLREDRINSLSIDYDPISTRTKTVEVKNESHNVTISSPTGMNEDEWKSVFEDEMVDNGGHVLNVTTTEFAGSEEFSMLKVTLENGTYSLQLAKVGVGTGATETDPVYLTDIEGNGTSVDPGETRQLTLEVRDKFNVPQSNVAVTGAPEGGSFRDDSKTSGNDGRVTFRYEAKDPGTHQINFTIKPGYMPDDSHDATTPRNVTMTVPVLEEKTSGGGGGGGAYNVSWQNPSGNSAVTETSEDGVYDYNATEASELDLTMKTAEPTDGASVDFSVSNRQKGTVPPNETITVDSKATTTFTPKQTGEVDVYTSSGGSGDVLTLNITDINTGQPDPLILVDGSTPGPESSALEFDIKNAAGEDVTITEFSISTPGNVNDAVVDNVDNINRDAVDNPEDDAEVQIGDGYVTPDFPGGGPDGTNNNFATDGTTYDMARGGNAGRSEEVTIADGTVASVDMGEFNDGDVLLTYTPTDNKADSDVTVTFTLEDGTAVDFYFRVSNVNS